MKLKNYFCLNLLLILTGCNWPEQEVQPFYVKEDGFIGFYNDGDSLLERMTLSISFYRPVEITGFQGRVSKEKTINEIHYNEWACYELYPQDSIICGIRDCYIGCERYARFAVYDKDSTSIDGYRLRGEYIVDDTIRQKYADKEYKYPDKTTIIVRWPEDSLLFK